jgi:hypothetical protein
MICVRPFHEVSFIDDPITHSHSFLYCKVKSLRQWNKGLCKAMISVGPNPLKPISEILAPFQAGNFFRAALNE